MCNHNDRYYFDYYNGESVCEKCYASIFGKKHSKHFSRWARFIDFNLSKLDNRIARIVFKAIVKLSNDNVSPSDVMLDLNQESKRANTASRNVVQYAYNLLRKASWRDGSVKHNV